MGLPPFDHDMDIIQKLDDEPNDVGGLTAAELKAKFDEPGNAVKQYMNTALIPAVDAAVDHVDQVAEEIGQFTADNIKEWLDEHPEATTTVENGSISTVKLADGAVTTGKIADGAVTEPKLGNGAVATAKLADGSVTISKLASDVTGELDDLDDRITALLAAVGSPLTANSASAMTDTTKIYVYTGNTTASLTNGHWYYYYNNAWTDGGVYNSTALETDTTLSVAGMAADAEATGDEIDDLKDAFDLGNQYGPAVSTIEISELESTGITIAEQTSGAYRVSGTATAVINRSIGSFAQTAGQRYHFRLDMSEGNSSAKRYYIYLYGVDGTSWKTVSEYDWVAADTKTIAIKLYCNTGAAPDFTIKPVLALNPPNAYLQEQITDLGDEFNSATTITDFDLITDIGSINSGQHTWPTSTSRVRIMWDHPVHLPVGAKIYLTDYSAAQLYIVWKSDDGVWGARSWIASTTSADFQTHVTTVSGNYWVLLRADPEATVTDKRTLTSLLRIQTPASIYDHLTAQAPTTQNYNHFVRSINHRGYSRIAPENTIPAFQLSKKVGFWGVETDVRFTSDGVPVLLHDTTINRTARNADGTEISGTVNIADITYEQALEYDFGIYMGEEFAGTKIPTLAEFVVFCKKASMEMYIEIKDETGTRVEEIVNLVKSHGMLGHASWIAFSYSALEKVLAVDGKARIGLIAGGISTATVDRLNAMQTANNTVFCSAAESVINSGTAPIITSAGFELETYTPNSIDTIVQLSEWVTGVTSDYIVAGQVLLESAL